MVVCHTLDNSHYFMGSKRWQGSQSISLDVGGLKTAMVGEQVALKKLDRTLQNGTWQGVIRITWDVVKPALHPTPQRSNEVWLYGLFYNQQNKRLLHYTLSPRFTDPRQADAVQYDDVANEVIHSTATSNGTLKDLVQQGATLTRQGNARFDEKEGLVFR